MRFLAVNATSDSDQDLIAAADVPQGKRIRVINYVLNVNAAGVITLQDTDNTLLAKFELLDSTSVSFVGTINSPAFDLALGKGLEISNASSVDTFGHLAYEFV
jgi:hypothetical protein